MSTRMNDNHRTRLMAFMREFATCPKEAAAVERAQRAWVAAIRPLVETKWPAKDMKVLAKYACTRELDCLKLELTAGGIVGVSIPEGAPFLAPDDYNQYTSILPANAAQTAATDAYLAAKSAHDEALKKLHADYASLIRGAATLDEIVQVWPQAGEHLAPYIKGNLPMVLSSEVIGRIKADAASRQRGGRA